MTDDQWEEDYLSAAEAMGSVVLEKAMNDPFRYACRLKGGESFTFEFAKIDRDWIHFTEVRDMTGFPPAQEAANPRMDRGLDVRLDQLTWILDGTS